MRLINQVPARGARLLLAALPFALLLAVYMTASTLRLAENADDKLLPSIGQMAQAVQRMAFTEDPRSGDLLWWKDTGASLQRLGLGLGISALAATQQQGAGQYSHQQRGQKGGSCKSATVGGSLSLL